jgi:hypothetical protein
MYKNEQVAGHEYPAGVYQIPWRMETSEDSGLVPGYYLNQTEQEGPASGLGDGMSAWWIGPLALGVVGVGGFVAIWVLIASNSKRNALIKTKSEDVFQAISTRMKAPFPAFIAVANGFTTAERELWIAQAAKQGISVISPSTITKNNAILISDKSGKSIVICVKPADIINTVATSTTEVDWDHVDSIINAASAGNPSNGWFKGSAITNWQNDIKSIKSLIAAGKAGASPLSATPRARLTVLDWILLAGGIGSAGWLATYLARKQKRTATA